MMYVFIIQLIMVYSTISGACFMQLMVRRGGVGESSGTETRERNEKAVN